MVRLLLMRHAEAESGSSEDADFERNLTESGREVARQTGALLKSLNICCDQVLASSAHRTMQTADTVIDSAGWSLQPAGDRQLYNARAAWIRSQLRAVATRTEHALLMVGHNPGIGMLICELAGSSLPVPPGTLAVFAAGTFDELLVENPCRFVPEFLIIGGQQVPAERFRTAS
jgi:phosphohistidine phosphatase